MVPAGLLLAFMAATAARARQTLPAVIAAPGTAAVLTVLGVGAQIYRCIAGADGKPGWQFREPIATLTIDGRTVGRHFAGPSWELADGSPIAGVVSGRSPGAAGDDIPWLRLDGSGGSGQFANVATIQRINTRGGALAGPCDKTGEPIAAPYASDYVFLTKGD
jgi:hypothetical protein